MFYNVKGGETPLDFPSKKKFKPVPIFGHRERID